MIYFIKLKLLHLESRKINETRQLALPKPNRESHLMFLLNITDEKLFFYNSTVKRKYSSITLEILHELYFYLQAGLTYISIINLALSVSSQYHQNY